MKLHSPSTLSVTSHEMSNGNTRNLIDSKKSSVYGVVIKFEDAFVDTENNEVDVKHVENQNVESEKVFSM